MKLPVFKSYWNLGKWQVNVQDLINEYEMVDFSSINLKDYYGGVVLTYVDSKSILDKLRLLKKRYSHGLFIIALVFDKELAQTPDIYEFTDYLLTHPDELPFLRHKILSLYQLKNREIKSILIEQEYLKNQKDIELARHIQDVILQETPPYWPNLDIQVQFLTAGTIGGDIWDFQIMSNEHIGIFLADVAGHGVGSALVASMTKILFRTFAPEINNPAWLLACLNDLMVDILAPVGRFITAFYGIFHHNTLRYSNAGHTSPLIYSPEEDLFYELTNTAYILGYSKKVPIQTTEIQLKPGHIICLFTDGLIEVTNEAQQMFGIDRLKEFIRQNHKEKFLANPIIQAVKDFVGEKGEIEDDITLLTIRVR